MSARIAEALPKQYTYVSHRRNEPNYNASDKILIAPITAADITKAHALECRVYAFPWSHIIISDCVNSQYECWMMMIQDHVIAYSVMMLGVSEGHLLNLCVDPNFRRQGYADCMIRFLSDIAVVKNAKRMFLEVRESNYPAINLYRKLGFQQISRRLNYYPTETDREDALVLAKLL